MEIVDTTVDQEQEYVSILSSKGGVTIPVEVRRMLKVRPKDKVVFRVQKDRVEVDTPSMSLEDTYGSVKPINRPEDFSKLIRTAKEERTRKVIAKMNS